MIEVLLVFAGVAVIVFVVVQMVPRERVDSRETLLSRTFAAILEGERETVLEDMRRLYQQTSQDPGVGMALGILLRHAGKHQVAIRTHRSLTTRTDLEPDFETMIHAELAEDYLACGLLERARSEIETALADRPGDTRAVATAELIYRRLGAWDAAVEAITAYGKKQNEDVSKRLGMIHVARADAAREEERPADARAGYKKALSVDDTCLPAVLGIVGYYRSLEKWDKALSFLDKHAAKFEKLAHLRFEALLEIARETEDHGLFENAVARYLEDHPDDWRTLRVRARFLRETGVHEEAGELLLRCIEERPQVLILHKDMWSLLLGMPEPAALMRRYQHRVKRDMVFSHTWECKICFFHASTYLWHCPNCHTNHSFAERKI